MWLHVLFSTDFTLPCYLIIANTIETCSEARKSTKQRFLLFHTFVIMAQVKTNCLFQCVLVWRVAVRTLLEDKGLSSSRSNCKTSFPEGDYNCSLTVHTVLVHKSKQEVVLRWCSVLRAVFQQHCLLLTSFFFFFFSKLQRLYWSAIKNEIRRIEHKMVSLCLNWKN